MPVTAHFVTFYSPGTFVAEQTRKPVESWDVAAAFAMSKEIEERHGARPFGFQFSTNSRGDANLDSKEVARSPMHFIKGTVRTLAEVEREANPGERTLLANMRGNGWDKVVTTKNGYTWTQPLKPEDVVLDAEGRPV